ncbi:Ctr copper transporter family-domain-containing protein [Scleroderma yunnanense]
MSWQYLAVFLLYHAQCSVADNGMDMSMDGSMGLALGKMVPYLHFTIGDTLWFLGWVPQSVGAMVGACIGLFLLALLERWLAASRSVMELHWNARANLMLAEKLNTSKRGPFNSLFGRVVPPFYPAHDIPRGVVFAAHALLNYLFMLAVMTFQVGFISALVVGEGVGETLFGRYASSVHLH